MAEKPDAKTLFSKENEERAAEFEKIAFAEEARIEKAVKSFDPQALFKTATELHEVDHPTLGRIKYGELTLEDNFILNQCITDEDKTSMALYLMLKKAYPEMPTYTAETIKEWRKTIPLFEGAALLKLLVEQPAFLRSQSLLGSTTAQQPRK